MQMLKRIRGDLNTNPWWHRLTTLRVSSKWRLWIFRVRCSNDGHDPNQQSAEGSRTLKCNRTQNASTWSTIHKFGVSLGFEAACWWHFRADWFADWAIKRSNEKIREKALNCRVQNHLAKLNMVASQLVSQGYGPVCRLPR